MVGACPKVIAGAALILLLSGIRAEAQSDGVASVKAGMLSCNVDSGWGFVFGSTRDIKCSYLPTSGTVEHYVGHISKFGVDIGYVSGGLVAWAVLAPSKTVEKGALAGDYGGVTGSATVAAGGGVNVLIGGFKNSLALQPISFEGSTGINVAGGIAQMTLEYQPS